MTGARSAPAGVSEPAGRHRETQHLDAFADAIPTGVRAILIRGDVGVGKTTLWRWAVDRYRDSGFQVLTTRPSEEELAFPLVGLVDLFEHVEVDPMALDSNADPFARGRAVLEILRGLTKNGPTIVAIDDLQWLDPLSVRAMRFALRRFDTEAIGVIATIRSGADPSDLLTMASVLPPGRSETIELSPLGLEDLRRVLSGTVRAISRPMLRHIHKISGGNPMYAIELARSLSGDQWSVASPVGISLPGSLQAAIAHRLEGLPAEILPLLQAASALGRTSIGDLRVALSDQEIDGLIVVAQAHGLLVVEDDLRVRFAHPLLGSAVYGQMSGPTRRGLHAHLAGSADDSGLKARHLALSVDDADPVVARMLEEAADQASGRGALALAAEFTRHSLRLTPPDDEDAARRRALAEIVYLTGAGEVSRARSLADDLVATLPPGSARAEVLIERVFVEDDDTATNERLLRMALADAGVDEALRAQVLDVLGWRLAMFGGDIEAGIRCAREAVEIAERLADPELEMLATTGLGAMAHLAGDSQPGLMARAVALAERLGLPSQWAGPRVWTARQLLWAGDLPASRAMLASDVSARKGSEFRRPYTLQDLALIACASGDFREGRSLVDQAMEAARDAEDTYSEAALIHPLALAEAWLGRASSARSAATRYVERALVRGERPSVVRGLSVLGLLALSEGDAREASRVLGDAAGVLEEMGVRNPGAFPVLPDAVEAFATVRDASTAASLQGRLDDQAAAADEPWARAAADRGRGVLMLAEGDAAAADAFERAAVAFDDLGFKPDAARAVLLRGRALVRDEQRTAAAEVLDDARARFAGMSAALWEARAIEELERVAPGRAAGELTSTERRITRLVADGMKNKEIAAALFVSVATVEAHLTRIYRKLKIRSRSELARLVFERSLLDEPQE